MSQERTPLLSVRNLVVNYGAIKALQGLDLDVYAGEIMGRRYEFVNAENMSLIGTAAAVLLK